jgi:hypothetical protein
MSLSDQISEWLRVGKWPHFKLCLGREPFGVKHGEPVLAFKEGMQLK